MLSMQQPLLPEIEKRLTSLHPDIKRLLPERKPHEPDLKAVGTAEVHAFAHCSNI